MKFNLGVMKFDFVVMKFDLPVMKFDFAVMKFDFGVVKFDFAVMKFDVGVVKFDFRRFSAGKPASRLSVAEATYATVTRSPGLRHPA